MWGQLEIYKDDRLTWFGGGQQNFSAGSTRTSILPRKSIIGNIILQKLPVGMISNRP